MSEPVYDMSDMPDPVEECIQKLQRRITELEAEVAKWKKLCGEFEAQRDELNRQNEELAREKRARELLGRCAGGLTEIVAERDKLREACQPFVEAWSGDGMVSGFAEWFEQIEMACCSIKEALGHD